jgi:hypothetical protein
LQARRRPTEEHPALLWDCAATPDWAAANEDFQDFVLLFLL